MSPHYLSAPVHPRLLGLARIPLFLILLFTLIGWANPVSAGSLLPSPTNQGPINASPAVSATVTVTPTVTVTATTGVSQTTPSALTETTALTKTIALTGTIGVTTGAAVVSRTATIVTNGGYIRSGPGVNNSVVAVGARGDTFTVIDQDQSGNWLQICCVEGSRETWIGAGIVKVTEAKVVTSTGVLTATSVLTGTSVLTQTGVLTNTVALTTTLDASSPIATISTNRGNIRSGPGTNNPIVAVGARGDSFTIVAQDEAGAWLQVCCLEDGRRAWIAESIVAVRGDLADIPVAKALFPADFRATWRVDYTCDSDRCAVPACSGTMSAAGRQFVRTTYLEIDRRVEWAEGCGDDSYWLHQVDNFSGNERYPRTADSPLFHFWIGALSAAATERVTLADGQSVAVICAGPYTQETAEDDGWTSVYTGNTCHDLRTGMIVTMHYDKKWLFSGEFEGKTYSREFFGDRESYQLTLSETNAELAGE